jgi:hypothetical protein
VPLLARVRKTKMNKIHDLARHLECLLLRFLEPQHRGSAIRYTCNKKTLSRSSIVVDVFKPLLEGDTDKIQDLLQALKEEICIIRTGKSGGDVQLSDEMITVFQELYQSLRDCKDANVDRDAALRALAGIHDYFPYHPIEAMHFVLEYIPTFVTQGGEAIRHLERQKLEIINCYGCQPSKQLLVRFFDKNRITRRDGYMSDMFRIVFMLYYWPYAKAETNDSLCVLPDYRANLIPRKSYLFSGQKRQQRTESHTHPLNPSKRRKSDPCNMSSSSSPEEEEEEEEKEEVKNLDSFLLNLEGDYVEDVDSLAP